MTLLAKVANYYVFGQQTWHPYNQLSLQLKRHNVTLEVDSSLSSVASLVVLGCRKNVLIFS